MKRFKHIAVFLTLCLILIIPWLLKTVSLPLEIYPSVVLPSGAHLGRTDSTFIETTMTEFVGLNSETNNEYPIKPSDLLHPIPNQYYGGIYSRKFGLDQSHYRQVRLKYLPFLQVRSLRLPIPQVTEVEQEEAKSWIRAKFSKNGFQADKLIVRKMKLRVNKGNGEITSSDLINEELIDLL